MKPVEQDFQGQAVMQLHAIVRGRVQGVGFRATTRYLARNLGLVGTVRNLSDGSVEIYAQGTKRVLEQLIQQLYEEIGFEYIESFSKDFQIPQHTFEGYNIII